MDTQGCRRRYQHLSGSEARLPCNFSHSFGLTGSTLSTETRCHMKDDHIANLYLHLAQSLALGEDKLVKRKMMVPEGRAGVMRPSIMTEDSCRLFKSYDRGGPLGPSTNLFPLQRTVTDGYCSKEPYEHLQIQHKQFQLLRKQQQLQNKARAGSLGQGRFGVPLGASSSSPWSIPPQPRLPQTGSGMRAIFLDSSRSKRESVGTGVFLPRKSGSSNGTRMKPACATVLVPARVVHALNLNLNEMGSMRPRSQEPKVRLRSNGHLSLRPSAASSSCEVHLPQEWTY